MRYAIRSLTALLLLVGCGFQCVVPASAYYYSGVTRTRLNHGSNYYYHRRPVTMHQYFADHPKVKAATIGAGVGAAAGAVTGLVSGRGIGRGALIGAGTGAGVGLIRSSHIMRRHPIVKDLATGSAVGAGLGWAAGRHGGFGKGALVGGAVGLGIGLLRNGL